MIFQYTAINTQGARLTDTLEAPSLSAAQQELLQRGLFVLNVAAARTATVRSPAKPDARALEPKKPDPRGGDMVVIRSGTNVLSTVAESSDMKARASELIMMAKQMGMMLQAGAPMVPAMQAIAEQATRPAWAAVMADLVQRVGAGAALHEAMAYHKRAFPGTARSLVRAGEATGQLAYAFAQLAKLLESRHRVRQKVISSLAYPVLLTLLSISVVCGMTFFILPRFAGLFKMLNTEIPMLTSFMLASAEHLKTWWPLAIGAPLGCVAAILVWMRTRRGKDALGRLLFRLPFIGRVIASVLLTQVLQLWAAALRSKVPLLEAIQQAREISNNPVILEMIESITLAVEQGNSLSAAMRRFRFVPVTVITAVSTGEQSGKLGEALDFVSLWLEEESSALVTGFTRLLEPLILIGMGVLVGSVAIALFLPLFDLATAM